jgi:type IV secretory pathway VirJ component
MLGTTQAVKLQHADPLQEWHMAGPQHWQHEESACSFHHSGSPARLRKPGSMPRAKEVSGITPNPTPPTAAAAAACSATNTHKRNSSVTAGGRAPCRAPSPHIYVPSSGRDNVVRQNDEDSAPFDHTPSNQIESQQQPMQQTARQLQASLAQAHQQNPRTAISVPVPAHL